MAVASEYGADCLIVSHQHQLQQTITQAKVFCNSGTCVCVCIQEEREKNNNSGIEEKIGPVVDGCEVMRGK